LLLIKAEELNQYWAGGYWKWCPNNRSCQGGSGTYIYPWFSKVPRTHFHVLSTNLRLLPNIREYSNILIDRRGAFVEIVPNEKPQVVKAVLEEISQVYIYIPTVLMKYPRTGSDISTHKSLLFFFKRPKDWRRRKRENLLDHKGIFSLFFLW
jgi:hypothetical protein